MKGKTRSILKYMLEMLIVSFGVFLGIYVSEWRGDLKAKENAKKSLTYIIKELQDNSANLEKAYTYHETLSTELDSIQRLLSPERFEDRYYGNSFFRLSTIPSWAGVGMPKLQDVAFESAKISGNIQAMEGEVIQLLSYTYGMQESYNKLANSTLDRILSTSTSTTIGDVYGTVELITNDVMLNEEYINERIIQSIDKLKKYEF